MSPSESCGTKIRFVGSVRRLSLSIIFLVSCSGFAQPQLDDHVPGLKVRPAGTEVANSQRQAKRDPSVSILPGSGLIFTAVFIHSFVRFDRKQNTRLWPFVTRGTTRAPPAAFSV
jgi:hypothetical protein